jgi:hypothetical protein
MGGTYNTNGKIRTIYNILAENFEGKKPLR